MDCTVISPEFSISGQITPEDVITLAGLGVTNLICNRPDAEEAQQPSFADIAGQAKRLNLNCHYQPVQSGQVTTKDVEAFSRLLSTSKGKTHAYCRTGRRCATLWSMAQDAARE